MQEAQGGKVFPVQNPATEEVVAQCPDASREVSSVLVSVARVLRLTNDGNSNWMLQWSQRKSCDLARIKLISSSRKTRKAKSLSIMERDVDLGEEEAPIGGLQTSRRTRNSRAVGFPTACPVRWACRSTDPSLKAWRKRLHLSRGNH